MWVCVLLCHQGFPGTSGRRVALAEAGGWLGLGKGVRQEGLRGAPMTACWLG